MGRRADMGYTHYWTAKRDSDTWRSTAPRWMADAQRIIEAVRARGIDIAGFDYAAGEYALGAPVLTEVGLALNGWGSDEFDDDLGHESFVIELIAPANPERFANGFCFEEHMQRVGREHGGDWAGFCKTARKPYDLAVAAILLRGALLMPDALVVCSDGSWGTEWLNGGGAWDGGDGEGARRLVAELFDLPAVADPGYPSVFATNL